MSAIPASRERLNSRIASAFCPAVAVVFSVAFCVLADEPVTQPAVFRPRPLPPAKTIDEGLKYTDVEKIILGAVRDATDKTPVHQHKDKALFVLLRRAAAMPKPTADQLDALDRPSYQNILARPARYRGEAVRYIVRVCRSRRLSPGRNLARSAWWPKDADVWEVDCIDGEGKYPGDRPLRIYCPFDPAAILGKGTQKDGDVIYDLPGKRVELAAIFFKVFAARPERQAQGMPDELLYPCLVAWHMKQTSQAGSARPGIIQLTVIIVILVLMVAAFVFVKRRSSRARAATQRRYRPLRKETMDESEHIREKTDHDEPVDVDPALKAAAEEYRQEHPNNAKDGHN